MKSVMFLCSLAVVLVGCSPWSEPPVQTSLQRLTSQKNFQDPRLPRSMGLIEEGQWTQASSLLNEMLQDHPHQAVLHLLNGMLYEKMVCMGDSSKVGLAEVAYQNAIKLDPSHWYSLYRMGRVKFEAGEYRAAQDFYAQALLIRPSHSAAFHELAAASYYAQDFKLARGAIQKALQLAPQDPAIHRSAAMIFAAVGETRLSEESFRFFERYGKNAKDIPFFSERLKDWKRFRQRYVRAQKKISAGPGNQMSKIQVVAKQKAPSADDNMAIFECCFLRVSEEGSTSKGSNILDLLKVSLGSDGDGGGIENSYAYKHSRSKTGRVSRETVFQGGLSWKALNYNLNIANVRSDRVEVVGRPRLVGYLGREATLQSGERLVAGIKGETASSGSTTEIPVGANLKITPHKITRDSVFFGISLRGSILDTHNRDKSIAEQIIVLHDTKIETTLEVKWNQTAMLGGLFQKIDTAMKDGVPFLQSIPFVQYFFSKENNFCEKKSVLFLVTPRRSSIFQHTLQGSLPHSPKKRSKAVRELVTESQLLPDFALALDDVLHYMAVPLRELRKGDVHMSSRDLRTPLAHEIRQALEFTFF